MPTIPYTRATHSDGQSWSAAKANALEGAANDSHFMPVVRVTHNTTQSITNATETTLAFNTERFDQAGNAADTQHDTATNNSRLTCKYAGVYQITANIIWAASPVIGYIRLRVNGTTNIAIQGIGGGSVDTRYMNVTTLYNLAVNDYVEVRVLQSSGGSINVSNVGNESPEFMMCRVG